ncbi:MAG: GntR family transcriptional regulator [Bacteroidales bacterium]
MQKKKGASPATRRAKPAPSLRADAGGRRSVTTEAYRQLRDLIIAGRLAPGAPLIETDLSVRLGVSRTPVRAALQRLQQEGFVDGTTVGHMLRAVVAPLTADDMRELFAMVGALEGVAARWAAEVPLAPRQKLVHELERLNREMSAAARARPQQIAYAQDLHERFHQIIVEAAAGRRLRAELASLQPQAERYGRAYTGASIHDFHESLNEHDAIIAALGAGDPDAAEQTMARNWRNGAERYRHVVELHGDRGAW